MVQRVHTVLVSDLSEKIIKQEDGQTINFSYRGVDYRIDVTGKEADQFDKAIGKYLAAAQRISGRRPTKARATASVDQAQTKMMREWLNQNGYEVSNRGRIPHELQEAYHARA